MNHRRKQTALGATVIAVLAGMGGEMHVYVPGFGTIAMLDLTAYIIALPIIFMNWSKMGKFMKRALLWGFAWAGAAMLANAVYFVDIRYWLKCVSVVSSSWAIVAASYMLLKDRPINYLWYLVGAGLGGWIALYHFRNGAYEYFATQGDFGAEGYGVEFLLDKQTYPLYARAIVFSGILTILMAWRGMPILGVLCGFVFAGFYMLFHGGSRSSFGLFCAAGGVGFLVAYGGRMFRRLGKHPYAMLLICGIGGAILFGGYKYMASSGMMGAGEAAELENEFGEGGRGAVKGRAGFDYAFEFAIDTFGIGAGGNLRNHSVMANALSCEGFIGFFFWVYFYTQCLWFVCRRIPYSGKYSAFIMLMLLTACWDAFGSPFGTRHKFFVLMALMAISRDNPLYGVGEIYSTDMIRRREIRI